MNEWDRKGLRGRLEGAGYFDGWRRGTARPAAGSAPRFRGSAMKKFEFTDQESAERRASREAVALLSLHDAEMGVSFYYGQAPQDGSAIGGS